MHKNFILLSLICVSLLLSGCGRVDLFSQLQENEANKIIAILLRRGIGASKNAGKENTFIVQVEEIRFSDAIDILERSGYPREHFEGIGATFKKAGLVSSPTEERIRFMHALSEELSETISHIDGVLTARVQIVLPNNDPYTESTLPASASVFIKHRFDADIDSAVPQIKNLVVNSIEGLKYDNISLATFPSNDWERNLNSTTESPFRNLLGVQVASQSVEQFWILFGATAGLLSACLAFLVYLFSKRPDLLDLLDVKKKSAES